MKNIDDPTVHCLMPGVPRVVGMPFPLEIIQTPNKIVILYEAFRTFRVIPTDGKKVGGEAAPSFNGDSVGHWEGDTLVFDTVSTKHSEYPEAGDTVLDRTGLVLSDAAHVVTRLRRLDAMTMEARMVVEDSKAFTAPWNVTKTYRKVAPGTRVYDYGCAENMGGL